MAREADTPGVRIRLFPDSSTAFCSTSCLARLQADCQAEAGSEKER